jgi:hypothetical protein
VSARCALPGPGDRGNPPAGAPHARGFGERLRRVGEVEQHIGEDDGVGGGGGAGERAGARVGADGGRAAAGAGEVEHARGCVEGNHAGLRRS